jgi:predicted secreted protein
MSILEVIIFFLVVWWPVFFIILPIGFQQLPQKEIKFARSAPNKPNILIKFIITTIFAILVTIIFWILSFFNIFTLKNLFL